MLPSRVIEEFCHLCGRAYELWRHHRELFDDNPRHDELNNASFTGPEFRRLSIISQEYAILQIAKLHDKGVSGSNRTLSIDYVFTQGGWSKAVSERLKPLKDKLDRFAKPLQVARNKILAHSDLYTIEKRHTLGAFPEGEEEEYFETLEQFVYVVHAEALRGPCTAFDTLVKNDVVAFLAAIKPQ